MDEAHGAYSKPPPSTSTTLPLMKPFCISSK
jgi:hypothetical protein